MKQKTKLNTKMKTYKGKKEWRRSDAKGRGESFQFEEALLNFSNFILIFLI